MKDFKGVDRLIRHLCKSPGTPHHLCLAADLHKKKYLIGLEPETGAGSATNDLLVSIGWREYEIEVKNFISNVPDRRLTKEINEKVEKLPSHPIRPVVFHSVLSENKNGKPDKGKEDQFIEALDKLSFELSPKINAVLGGRCLIDASGGRVKRDTVKMIINSNALLKSNEDDLKILFTPNYEKLTYPCFGIGNFLYIS